MANAFRGIKACTCTSRAIRTLIIIHVFFLLRALKNVAFHFALDFLIQANAKYSAFFPRKIHLLLKRL